jgi:anaerobic ribonucleoside-triphosphate reductase
MNDKKQIMVGKGIKFERIRRITGYLTGTIDRWNNAKNAEQKDRVKHSLV